MECKKVETFAWAGKGWYNLDENDVDLYRLSKLSRMVKLLHFHMEDTLRNLVVESSENFLTYIQDACSVQVRQRVRCLVLETWSFLGCPHSLEFNGVHCWRPPF